MSVTHLRGSKQFFFCCQLESRKFGQKKSKKHLLPGVSFLQLICLKKECNGLKVGEIVKGSRKTSLTRFQCFHWPLSLEAM